VLSTPFIDALADAAANWINGRKLLESFSMDVSKRERDVDKVDVADPRENDDRVASVAFAKSSRDKESGNALPPPFNGDNGEGCALPESDRCVLTCSGNPVTAEEDGLKTESPNEDLFYNSSVIIPIH
jgi:hypothetical protein